MAVAEHEFKPTGKIRRPDVEQLCEWIREAWARISPTLIEKSFKRCSISNKLDGMEDIYGTVIPTTRDQWTTMKTKAVEKNTSNS
jgi:hypothetical protein